MDLISLKVIKNLLKKYGVFPSRRLGQNFLINKLVLFKIIETACLTPKDVVLEIGPGVGNLTQELAKRVKKVIAVEKDPKMCEILKETLKNYKNMEIIQGDILKINFQYLISNFQQKPKCQMSNTKSRIKHSGIRNFIGNWELGIGNYKVVANLPYYIVAPVIRKFLENTRVQPVQMVFLVQKEVAQRICAKPPDMNLLAVSVQFYAKPEIISFISKNSFWPQPKVDSAIIRIAPLINADRELINADLFFRIVKAGFSQPRKQILNNLSKMLKLDKPRTRNFVSVRGKEKVKSWLLKNNIQPSQRAETLSLKDWVSLTNQVVETR